MQSLLDDPTFYNLLLSNNESVLSDDTNGLQKSTTTNNDTNINQVEDFSFLKKLEYPIMDQFQSSVATETSYQSSVFSNSANNNNKTNELIDINLNDFYSKEMNLQINSEITTTTSPSTAQTNTRPASTATTIESATNEFQSQFPVNQSAEHTSKQFHKFYTSNPQSSSESSTNPISIKSSNSSSFQLNQLPTKITKPSLPSSSTIHICPFCQRQFKNKPYLARHLKKHDTVKDFKCPFFSENEAKCHHLNGEFSRKDTYKAHLKSIHFIYPVGVFKSDRNQSTGRCAGCFKEFTNNNEWMVKHIENNECPGLIENKNNEVQKP